MNSPIVSIILPNRNYSDFIADAINSVRAQTLKDFECIIIDDASTDCSVRVIKDLIRGDKRFKLVENTESIGISATRNIGLDMATGEYIAFLDSDDCYAEYFLEMLVDLARKENMDIAGATAQMVDAYFEFHPSGTQWNNNDILFYDNPIDMEAAPQNRKWIWIWRRIYKRELLKDIRFHEEMKVNGDDITFMLDLVWRVKRIAESNTVGVYHRVHPLSITSEHQGFNLERVKMFPRLFKYMRENLLDKYDEDFLRVLYKNLFAYMLNECLIKKNLNLTEQNKQDIRELLSESCQLIKSEYLPETHIELCRYLSWMK